MAERRRREDKGWQKWIGIVPIAFTLAAAVVASIIAFTTIELTVSANAEDLKSVKRNQEQFRKRIRLLETSSAAARERLEAIHQTQQRTGRRAVEDRREILDAIKSMQRPDR